MTQSDALPRDARNNVAVEQASEPPRMTHKQILVVLSGLMLGMLLAALDQTIVATALKQITVDLHGLDHYAWVVTAYLLTMTASTPLYGKISDLYGRKPIFQAAIVIFLVGSVLSGLSQNMNELIAFRALQGLGAGGLMTLAMAIVGDIISPRERGRYQGYFGAVFAVASVVGPLLGGLFTEHLSWRWVFYVNVPIGIIALVVTSSVLHIPFHRRDHKIDYAGAGVLVAAVASILLALSWGGKPSQGGYAWSSWQITGLFAAAVVLMGAFVVIEHHATEPILPLRLFRNKVFSVTNALGFVVGLAMFGAIINLPLYLQVVKGVSPTVSGLELLPLMVGVLTSSIWCGRMVTKLGRYKVFPVTGLALMAIGMWLLSTVGANTSFGWLALYMVVTGAGLGAVMQILVIAVQNAVDYADLGVATSANTFFRSMGGSLGVAIFGAVLTNGVMAYILGHTSGGAVRAEVVGALNTGDGTGGAKLSPQAADVFTGAYVHGIQSIFLWAMLICVVGFLLTLILPEIRLSTSSGLHRGARESAPGGRAGVTGAGAGGGDDVTTAGALAPPHTAAPADRTPAPVAASQQADAA